MGLRFRRSIRLAPGVRMNLSLSGLGLSLGPRGASVGIGSRGTFANFGVPGTGVSTRQRVGGRSQSRRSAADELAGLTVSFNLKEDGTVEIVGADGSTLSPRAIKLAREQKEDYLRNWLTEKCEHWNKGIEDLLTIHINAPPPNRPHPDARRREYAPPKPSAPVPVRPSFFARLFKGRRERIERQNLEAAEQHKQAVLGWERDRRDHDKCETERLRLFELETDLDETHVQSHLTEVLGRVSWPRETAMSLEVNSSATGALIDVDLPEIEDMPDKTASVAARGLKLNIKDRSDTQRRREYMTHVHGVAFRIVGEVFAALPRLERIVISGFSQRADRKTGQITDEYLYSVRVLRDQWSRINFSRLADIDLPSCFDEFEIRRNMTSTGVFKPIDPFTALVS